MSTDTLLEPLTSEEKKFYSSIFRTLDRHRSGQVSGLTAKPLLEASGLPLASLGEIWNLADRTNSGSLDQFGFCMTMRLIAHAQQGQPVNAELAQKAAPLAKFHTITMNSTGSARMSSGSPAGSRNSSVASASPQAFVPLLTQQQVAAFGGMFDRTATGPTLSGEQARDIFLKAHLPVQALEKIWNIVDQSQAGQLTRPQFVVAMHLIQSMLSKTMPIVPTVLPDQMWQMAGSGGSMTNSPIISPQGTPQGTPTSTNFGQAPRENPVSPPAQRNASSTDLNTWIMSPQQQQQYGAIFDSLDKSHSGALTGGDVANFLMTSKLPNDVLATIWELANLNDTEGFNRQEFAIAMYLVQKKLAGYPLPEETPTKLVESSKSLIIAPQPVAAPQPASAPPVPPPPTQPLQSQNTSHMNDLVDIFGSSSSAPAPAQPASTASAPAQFVPSSSFGRQLQQQQQQQQQQQPAAAQPRAPSSAAAAPIEEESSSDDEGPEDLDKPRGPPAIPGRDNKPAFGQNDGLLFSQAAPVAAPAFTVSPPVQPPLTRNFSEPASPTVSAGDRAIRDQLSQTTVDIANFSNQINSLGQQNANVSARRSKAEKQLARALKVKQDIQQKVTQLRELYQKESSTAQESEVKAAQLAQENQSLQQELSIAEANHHSGETKLKEAQQQYDAAAQKNTELKQQLSALNQEHGQLESTLAGMQAEVARAQNMLSVSEGQVAAQQTKNAELKQQVQQLAASLQQLVNRRSSLIVRADELEDEALDLQEKHLDLGSQYADRNLEYSQVMSTGRYEAPKVETVKEEEEEEGSKVTAASTPEVTAAEVPSVPTSSAPTASVSKDISESSAPLDVKKAAIGAAAVAGVAGTAATAAATLSQRPRSTSSVSSVSRSSSDSSYSDSESRSVSGSEASGPVSGHVARHSTAFSYTQSRPTSKVVDSVGRRPSQEIVPTVPESTSPSSKGHSESFELIRSEDAKPESGDEKKEEEEETEGEKEVAETLPKVEPPLATPSASSSSSNGYTGPAGTGTANLPGAFSAAFPSTAEEPTIPSFEDKFPSLDDVSSSSDDEFEDTRQTPVGDAEKPKDLALSEAKKTESDLPPVPEIPQKPATPAQSAPSTPKSPSSKNPFSAPSPAPATATPKKDLFDDLGLEEAEIEDGDEAAAFDKLDDKFSAPVGFSFSQAETPASPSTAAGDGADDWEQVFAGFGNAPGKTAEKEVQSPATAEFTGSAGFSDSGFTGAPGFSDSGFTGGFSDSGFTGSASASEPPAKAALAKDEEKAEALVSSKHTQSQSLAIEELKGMGFDEKKAVSALTQNNWNLDNATNFLLDNP